MVQKVAVQHEFEAGLRHATGVVGWCDGAG